MAARIKQLKDWVYKNIGGEYVKDEEITVYPVTRSVAVYMKNGKETVEDAIGDLMKLNSTIEFGKNSITETTQSGNKVVTTFGKNKITEKCTDSDNVDVYTRTTTFDGSSIEINTVWNEVE